MCGLQYFLVVIVERLEMKRIYSCIEAHTHTPLQSFENLFWLCQQAVAESCRAEGRELWVSYCPPIRLDLTKW